MAMFLNPAYCRPAAIAAVRRELVVGRLVVLRDAMRPTFAERMHRCLDATTAWRMYEHHESDFQYRHHNLYDPRNFPADLKWCEAIFDGDESKRLARRLSGADCSGPVSFSASWYLPGDHSLPHTDAVSEDAVHRRVAFVGHLTREWRSEWGGALFWCPQNLYVPPSFNTLLLFNVSPETYHFVTTVSPYARGKRLAISGWWTSNKGQPVARSRARVRRLPVANGIVEVY